ncbi:MAG: S8 family serine peptidase, partial [Myxococcota bacterium]
RAVAPDVRVRSVKCVDNSGWANFPVAGFQRAVEIGTPAPDIVVCSWVALELSVALQREIANAAERGVLVVFAAGNGTMRDTDPAEVAPVTTIDGSLDQVVEISNASYATRTVHAIAHPDALVVGGVAAYCNDDTLEEENVATAYDSAVFGVDGLVAKGLAWDGSRAVPDVCGLVAPLPEVPGETAGLTRTRTATDSTLDRKPDGSPPDDGTVLTAGSSMAAAQVAGAAALLRQTVPGLSPVGVKNVLMSTASNAGWRRRTGWGLVRASATPAAGERPTALTWLEPGEQPFLRATLSDLGLPGPRAFDVDADGLPSCPDLFFRSVEDEVNRQTRFGLTAKHVPGVLLAEPSADPPRFLYVRVTNRGQDFFGGPASVFTVTASPDGTVFDLVQVEERDVLAGPGELSVWPLGPVPEADAVLVEVHGGTPTIQNGAVTLADLVDIVENRPRVGVIAVPGGV